ncbi:MAG TPA: CoA transferase [Candidatus Binataceae bacterium]|jgi:crotonobetainyl-CoA:carnitine CoA-transferase CaiB-like acyl-CoA transferase|nr:CoA transferase [Candidatus Binataceae bacterium]
MSAYSHILDGYRILDFTQFIAGPTVTRLLAEMGAEVIKVELAPGGDPLRTMYVFKDGRSSLFVQHNRGKMSLCLDAKSPAGREILIDLARTVDVIVENFSPGAIARMGLGYDTVSQINPRIIMCSISGFGQSGPLANKPGFDTLGASYAGVIDMNGHADGPPCPPGAAIGDVTAGLNGAASIGFALLHRERTGRGQYLDISLLDTYFHCHDFSVQAFSASSGAIQPKRTGPNVPGYAPAGVFAGKQRSLVIMGITSAQWRSLCQVIGRPELGDDPEFSTSTKRVERMPMLRPLIQQWLDSMPSDEEIIRVLEENRIPVAPVLSVAEAVNHPHLRGRGTVTTVSDPVLGAFDVPASPWRFSEFPDPLNLRAPFLGEHNARILRQYLGYSDERLEQLMDDQILHCENR